MSEINNINSYQIQLDMIEVQNQQQSKEILASNLKSQESKVAENTAATKAEISKQVLADINKIISKEDVLINNLNKNNEIYKNLSSIRTQIAEIIDDLKNTSKYDDLEILQELNERSNNLIVSIENALKNEKNNGLIDFNYTNIFLQGLSAIKDLDITDNNYLSNLENLMASVLKRENSYKNILKEKENQASAIYKEYDALAYTPTTLQEESSSKLQRAIILEVNQTLRSVSSGLTPEVVLRLLQNQ